MPRTPKRVTTAYLRKNTKEVMDHAAFGGVVVIETTRSRHARAVLIGCEEAEKAGITTTEPE